MVSEVNPATVLELGTYCGYSAVRIASLLSPDAKLITLEFNPACAAIARQVIAWAGLEDKVKPDVWKKVEGWNMVCMSHIMMCFFKLGSVSWRSFWWLDPQNEGAVWGGNIWFSFLGSLERSLSAGHKAYGGEFVMLDLCTLPLDLFLLFYLFCFFFFFKLTPGVWPPKERYHPVGR